MKRTALAVILAGLAISLLGMPAKAAPDRTAAVNAGETFSWTGVPHTGVNAYYRDPAGLGSIEPAGSPVALQAEKCQRSETTMCDSLLVELANPVTAEEVANGTLVKTRTATVVIDGFSPAHPVSDFDVYVYESNRNGDVGRLVTSSTGIGPEDETQQVTFDALTTTADPADSFLIRVVYARVVNGTFQGTLTF